MKKFEIEVTRIGYAYKTMTVEANSREEAEGIALDEAGDEEFSERESDYILPNSSERFSLKIMMGEDACIPFQNIDRTDTETIEDIKEAISDEYGEEQVESTLTEMYSGIDTVEFETLKELEAFQLGFSKAVGYLEGFILDKDNKSITLIEEELK
jgi:hypothetical protein